MNTMKTPSKLTCSGEQIKYNTMTKTYRDGSKQILCASKRIFRQPGWEECKSNGVNQTRKVEEAVIKAVTDAEFGPVQTRRRDMENLRRSIRRARVKVRDYALSTDMKYFVTLTLDKEKVPSRYDIHSITKFLNAWLSNQVERRGLAYVMVPELHQDGALHFHALFNGALEAVDSGTVIPKGEDKPRMPVSAKQRGAWLRDGGRIVYNLPAWPYGFTTALQLEGCYERAVNYVCKYISKYLRDDLADDEPLPTKIGGRWYYSGGALGTPGVEFYNSDVDEVAEAFGEAAHEVDVQDMCDVRLVIVWVDADGMPRVRR